MQQMLMDPHGQTDVNPQELLPKEYHNQDLSAIIKDSSKIKAEEHLAIYQRSYIARLRDSMAKQFKALEYALGEDLFCGFADNYLENHPSSSYNLINLGKELANYLQETRPDAEEKIKEEWPDFMIELANFEYAINVMFDEKGEADETITAGEGLAEEDMRLTTVFRLFEFEFPIRRYYAAFASDLNPDLPQFQKSYCVILRHNYRLTMFDIHKEQFYFLQHLKQGYSVAEAKQMLHQQYGVDQEKVTAVWEVWKSKWLAANFFQSIQKTN